MQIKGAKRFGLQGPKNLYFRGYQVNCTYVCTYVCITDLLAVLDCPLKLVHGGVEGGVVARLVLEVLGYPELLAADLLQHTGDGRLQVVRQHLRMKGWVGGWMDGWEGGRERGREEGMEGWKERRRKGRREERESKNVYLFDVCEHSVSLRANPGAVGIHVDQSFLVKPLQEIQE